VRASLCRCLQDRANRRSNGEDEQDSSGPIRAWRIEQFLRDLDKELPEQKDHGSIRKGGNDQRLSRLGPSVSVSAPCSHVRVGVQLALLAVRSLLAHRQRNAP